MTVLTTLFQTFGWKEMLILSKACEKTLVNLMPPRGAPKQLLLCNCNYSPSLLLPSRAFI